MQVMRFYNVVGSALHAAADNEGYEITATWTVATFLDGEGARADALAESLRERLRGRIAHSLRETLAGDALDPRQGTILADRPAIVLYLVQISTEDPSTACRCPATKPEQMFRADDACVLHGRDPDAPRRETQKRNLEALAVRLARLHLAHLHPALNVRAHASGVGIEAWSRLTFADAGLLLQLANNSGPDVPASRAAQLARIGAEVGVHRASDESIERYGERVLTEFRARWTA